MGRPKRQFSEKDINQIKTLARCHCPDSEIAAFMECGERTIQRRFGALIKEQREVGRSNIRAKQYQLAMQGDKTMLVWLGKQLLGQREKSYQEIQHQVENPSIKQEHEEKLKAIIKDLKSGNHA